MIYIVDLTKGIADCSILAIANTEGSSSLGGLQTKSYVVNREEFVDESGLLLVEELYQLAKELVTLYSKKGAIMAASHLLSCVDKLGISYLRVGTDVLMMGDCVQTVAFKQTEAEVVIGFSSSRISRYANCISTLNGGLVLLSQSKLQEQMTIDHFQYLVPVVEAMQLSKPETVHVYGFLRGKVMLSDGVLHADETLHLWSKGANSFTMIGQGEVIKDKLVKAMLGNQNYFNKASQLSLAVSKQIDAAVGLSNGNLSLHIPVKYAEEFLISFEQFRAFSELLAQKPTLAALQQFKTLCENVFLSANVKVNQYGAIYKESNVFQPYFNLNGKHISLTSKYATLSFGGRDIAQANLSISSIRRQLKDNIDEHTLLIRDLTGKLSQKSVIVNAYTAAVATAIRIADEVIQANIAHRIVLEQLKLVLLTEVRTHHTNQLVGNLSEFVKFDKASARYVLSGKDVMMDRAKTYTKDMHYKYQDCDYFCGRRAGWKQTLDPQLTSGSRSASDFCESIVEPLLTISKTAAKQFGINVPLEPALIATQQTYTSCKKTSVVVQQTKSEPRVKLNSSLVELLNYINGIVAANAAAVESVMTLTGALTKASESLATVQEKIAVIEGYELDLLLAKDRLASFHWELQLLDTYADSHLEFVDKAKAKLPTKFSNSGLENLALAGLRIKLFDEGETARDILRRRDNFRLNDVRFFPGATEVEFHVTETVDAPINPSSPETIKGSETDIAEPANLIVMRETITVSYPNKKQYILDCYYDRTNSEVYVDLISQPDVRLSNGLDVLTVYELFKTLWSFGELTTAKTKDVLKSLASNFPEINAQQLPSGLGAASAAVVLHSNVDINTQVSLLLTGATDLRKDNQMLAIPVATLLAQLYERRSYDKN